MLLEAITALTIGLLPGPCPNGTTEVGVDERIICVRWDMAREFLPVIPCEGGWVAPWEPHLEPNGTYSWGGPQINSIHWQEMRERGLDPESEYDRWLMAGILYDRNGIVPWFGRFNPRCKER